MKTSFDVEREEMKKYHFVLLGFATFKEVLNKLEGLMKFYRFESQGKANTKEVIYDVANNLLTEAGIVLSKKTDGKNTFFNVMKISMLPGELKRLNHTHVLKEASAIEEPRDISFEIATAIENLFNTNFTFDLEAFIKKALPLLQIDVESENYKIIGGNGLRGYISYEKITYKDIKTNKKAFGEGVVLRLPNDEKYESENERILSLIERNIQELGQYNISKFELAQKLLYPKDEEEEE